MNANSTTTTGGEAMAYSSLNSTSYARSSAYDDDINREHYHHNNSSSNNINNKKRRHSHNDMTYHYAGRVHVRGLIRRVWRPRYLALGDDGYLRYHESVPPPFQQYQMKNSNNSQYEKMYNIHHTHRPKQILAILDGARTIDPNSVMDQHVALPDGVYGFVFRGRPVELSTSYHHQNNQQHSHDGGVGNELDNGATIIPLQGPFGGATNNNSKKKSQQSTPAAVVNMVFPQGSSRRRAAQQIAKAAVNPDVLCGGFGHSGGGGGAGAVSRSSSSSSLMGGGGESTIQVKVQASTVQSREYLCAVSTQEEAESWVVALKWAAEHRRRGRYSHMVTDGEHHVHELQRQSTDKITNSAAAVRSVPLVVNDETNENDNIIDNITEEEIDSSHEGTQGDSGLWSKGSLTSLLLEEDGWCKAEGKGSTEESLQSIPKEKVSPRKSITSDGPTIIITKVSRFRMPDDSLICWNTNTNHSQQQQQQQQQFHLPLNIPLPGDLLEIHFRIDLLLLNNCQVRTSEKSIQPESIQELTVYKSLRQILALVRGLQKEYGDNHNDNVVEDVNGDDSEHSTPRKKGGSTTTTTMYAKTTHLLDSAESDLLDCLTVKRGRSRSGTTIAEVSAIMNEYLTSIGTVDSVIRSLSKDQHVCSSSLFQEFLLEGASSETSAPPDLMTDCIEQYVRQWLRLMIRPSAWEKTQLVVAIALRHRFCGPVLSMTGIWILFHFFGLMWSAVSGRSAAVSIPLDRYVTLIALAFYLGHNKGASARHEVKLRKSKVVRGSINESFYEEQLSENDDNSTIAEDDGVDTDDDIMGTLITESLTLSSPLPRHPENGGITCWSQPSHELFKVRSSTYLNDRVKMTSAPAIFQCRGVDIWITDNAERNIAKHPSVLGGKLGEEDTFITNFLLPFANFVAYFSVPPLDQMPPHVARVWSKFVKGDQQYRDRKLKMLPIVMDGPWIVQKAVGPGTAPAVIGRDLPLQYYFTEPTDSKKGVYEVDIHVASSRIARGILNVVKGHIKTLTLAFAFIIEASEEADLPEQVLATFQIHSLHLEDCPNLPAIVRGSS
ncbi:hypothetical protein ACHAWC_008757 [Mediolabrus comicus]